MKEYFKKIEKSNCQNCGFKSKKKTGIAWVPPPKKVLGIIISRDPTVEWWRFYKYLKNEPQETRRKMLFASAIPRQLLIRVLRFMERFMEKQISKNDEKRLFDMIFRNVYWTHLHKCFTDTKNPPFEERNAIKCANEWLEKELELAINNKTKFIITLGNHVQDWVNKKWTQRKNYDIEIINLYHTSPQNNRIWSPKKRSRKIKETEDEIKNEIKKLIKYCKGN